MKDLAKICLDFYTNLYKHKEVSEVAIREVFGGFTSTFTDAMNENLHREITEEVLGKAITSMAKGKAPRHNGFPMELFQ